jgi:hypothetical protein
VAVCAATVAESGLWSNLGALARQSMGDIKEADVREALERLDPLWMNSSPPSRRASCICWWSGLMSPSWSFHTPFRTSCPKSYFWNDRLPFTMPGFADERSFTLYLPRMQGELKHGALGYVRRSPYTSPVAFNDRTADR